MSQAKDDNPPTDNEKNELLPLKRNIPERKLTFATSSCGQKKHFDGIESHASLFHTICSVIKSFKMTPEEDQIQKPSQACQEVLQEDKITKEDQISTESTEESLVLTEDGHVGYVLSKDREERCVPAEDRHVGPVLAKGGRVVPVLAEDKWERSILAKEGQEVPGLAAEGQAGSLPAEEDPVLAEDARKDKGLCKSIHSKQPLTSKRKCVIAGRQQILSGEGLSPAQMIPYMVLINRSTALPMPTIQSLCLAKKILCRIQCFTLRRKKKKLLPQPISTKQAIVKVQTDQDFVTFDSLKDLQWKLFKGIAKRKPKTTVTQRKFTYSIGKALTPCPRDAVYTFPVIPKNWVTDSSHN